MVRAVFYLILTILLFVLIAGALGSVLGILGILLVIIPVIVVLLSIYHILLEYFQNTQNFGCSFGEQVFRNETVKKLFHKLFDYTFNGGNCFYRFPFVQGLINLLAIPSIVIGVVLLLAIILIVSPLGLFYNFKLSDREKEFFRKIPPVLSKIKLPSLSLNMSSFFSKKSDSLQGKHKSVKKNKGYREIVLLFSNENERNRHYNEALKHLRMSESFCVQRLPMEDDLYLIKRKSRKNIIKIANLILSNGIGEELKKLTHLDSIILFLNTLELTKALSYGNNATVGSSYDSFSIFDREFLTYSSVFPNALRLNFAFVVPDFQSFQLSQLIKKDIVSADVNIDSLMSYWDTREYISRKFFLEHSNAASLFCEKLKGKTSYHILGDRAEKSKASLGVHYLNIMESVL